MMVGGDDAIGGKKLVVMRVTGKNRKKKQEGWRNDNDGVVMVMKEGRAEDDSNRLR